MLILRLCSAVALVLSMTGPEMERALALARARDSERQQFHSRYIVDLTDPVVTEIEVTTEFRRLELIAEEHVLRGDWMFTRGLQSAREALAPFRGMVALRANVRFNPLNTFVESPPYALALGPPHEPSLPLATQVNPQFSVPFKGPDGKNLTSLIGATLEATVPSSRIGQSTQTVAVILDGKTLAQTTIDFGRLD